MSTVADLRSYYEEEARRARRTAPKGFRTKWRAEFVARLCAERRRSVVDFGAGPGLDAGPFVAAGLRYVGLDLARGNAALARADGVDVVQGSMLAPPFRSASFEAGWSMSALMHVDEDDVPAALASMTSVLRPGAPLFIGLWGGERRDEIDETQIEGERRLFSLRPADRNRELLSSGAEVESMTVLEVGPAGWEYQGFLLRTPPERSHP